jgi:hypothetical protein
MKKKQRQEKTWKEVSIDSLASYIGHLKKNCPEEAILRGQAVDEPLLPKIARPELNLRDDISDGEGKMFKEFKRRATPFLDILPRTDWDWLALAQHYGLATRLLDWTKNSLAALWFAVRKPPTSIAQRGVVWIFKLNDSDFVDQKEKSDPFSLTKTKVFQPNHIARRLIVQDGWFTVHGYKKERGFIALNKNIFYKSRLSKIIIPANKFRWIRDELAYCGVNASTLFPELPGLCEHIVWDYSILEDEREIPGASRKASQD